MRYSQRESLTITGCYINITSPIVISACRSVRVIDCVFVSCPNPIQIRDSCVNVTIDRCVFDQCAGHNVQTDPTRHMNIEIRDCVMVGNGEPFVRPNVIDAAGDMIALRNVIGGRVAGNYVYNGGEIGIGIYHGCNMVSVSANIVKDLDAAGIQIGTRDSAHVGAIVCIGNTVVNCGRNRGGDAPNQPGILVRNAVHVECRGNVITRTDAYSSMEFGILARDVDGLVVAGNTFSGVDPEFRVPASVSHTVTHLNTDVDPRAS